ncbi:MAG: Fic family protein [Endomicrobia bacterium]|nr:Fic family protein [Endomicrobiia bacterium]MCL2506340.1 Fic family protein [Endomicrobiia bacterium]
MKLPEKPNFNWIEILKQISQENIDLFAYLLTDTDSELDKAVKKAINNCDYWDSVKYYSLPENITPEQFWALINFRKSNISKKQIYIGDQNCKILETSEIQKKLSIIDRHFSKYNLTAEEANEYSVNSLMEEGIASSQLEGAAVTREIAKEMLRTNSLPKSIDEQMILNNYKAMEYIDTKCGDTLSPEKIKYIHKIITEKTLENEEKAGMFRKDTDNVRVVDSRDNTLLFDPPKAENVEYLIEQLCSYANKNDEDDFIHPAIKAIAIHFWLAYIHPFVDGNGRTARALFYWYILKSGYKSFKYLVISRILKEKPIQYARAYLYSEYDDNDLTYFVNFNLDIILDAIKRFDEYAENKKEENKKTADLIEQDIELNFRQRSIMKTFIKDRNIRNIEYFKNTLNVAYETTRKDLDFLVKKGFLTKNKRIKQFVYSLSNKLKEKLKDNNN